MATHEFNVACVLVSALKFIFSLSLSLLTPGLHPSGDDVHHVLLPALRCGLRRPVPARTASAQRQAALGDVPGAEAVDLVSGIRDGEGSRPHLLFYFCFRVQFCHLHAHDDDPRRSEQVSVNPDSVNSLLI